MHLERLQEAWLQLGNLIVREASKEPRLDGLAPSREISFQHRVLCAVGLSVVIVNMVPFYDTVVEQLVALVCPPHPPIRTSPG